MYNGVVPSGPYRGVDFAATVGANVDATAASAAATANEGIPKMLASSAVQLRVYYRDIASIML